MDRPGGCDITRWIFFLIMLRWGPSSTDASRGCGRFPAIDILIERNISRWLHQKGRNVAAVHEPDGSAHSPWLRDSIYNLDGILGKSIKQLSGWPLPHLDNLLLMQSGTKRELAQWLKMRHLTQSSFLANAQAMIWHVERVHRCAHHLTITTMLKYF